MVLFRRRPRGHLPLGEPRLDGGGWPDPAAAGRAGFAARTHLEVATRDAFEPATRAVADLLLAAVLPVVETGAAPEDAPHLRGVLDAAARVGAGLGRVERGLGTPTLDLVHADVAAALWEARRALPAMPGPQARLASWLLLAGHRVARAGTSVVPGLVADLARDAGGAPGDARS